MIGDNGLLDFPIGYVRNDFTNWVWRVCQKFFVASARIYFGGDFSVVFPSIISAFLWYYKCSISDIQPNFFYKNELNKKNNIDSTKLQCTAESNNESRTNLLCSCWWLTHIHPCKMGEDLNRNDIKCENTREGFREDQSAWEFGKRFNICLQISCRV